MPEKNEEMTLLQSLLDCFASSRSMIKYVMEHEVKGHMRYELPLNNVVEWWKLLFSKNLVALSIAPRSHDKKLSKDTLSAFVRHVMNDKNKSVMERNMLPHLGGARYQEMITEEISHLEHTIDLGVRSAHSPWDKFSDSLSGERLKKSEDVQIYYDDAVRFLMELFLGAPYEILLRDYKWFADCVGNMTGVEDYTQEQILATFACALILCLNVTDSPQINANIESYIRSVFEPGEKSTKEKTDSSEAVHEPEEPPDVSVMEGTIKRAALKINMYELSKGRKPLDEGVELVIDGIIDSILMDLYVDILGVSAQLWKAFDIEQKAQTILRAYVHELSSIRDLSNDPNPSL